MPRRNTGSSDFGSETRFPRQEVTLDVTTAGQGSNPARRKPLSVVSRDRESSPIAVPRPRSKQGRGRTRSPPTRGAFFEPTQSASPCYPPGRANARYSGQQCGRPQPEKSLIRPSGVPRRPRYIRRTRASEQGRPVPAPSHARLTEVVKHVSSLPGERAVELNAGHHSHQEEVELITRHVVVVAVLVASCGAAHAAVLDAGTGQRYAQPSAAIAAAKNGDTVQIHPGQYFDCATIRQNNITI